MLQAALTYREVGYEGMLMTDHVPLVPVRHANGEYANNLGEESSPADGHLESFAFGYGYIRAIIQAAERFG
jgi:mannonate dehydratase